MVNCDRQQNVNNKNDATNWHRRMLYQLRRNSIACVHSYTSKPHEKRSPTSSNRSPLCEESFHQKNRIHFRQSKVGCTDDANKKHNLTADRFAREVENELNLICRPANPLPAPCDIGAMLSISTSSQSDCMDELPIDKYFHFDCCTSSEYGDDISFDYLTSSSLNDAAIYRSRLRLPTQETSNKSYEQNRSELLNGSAMMSSVSKDNYILPEWHANEQEKPSHTLTPHNSSCSALTPPMGSSLPFQVDMQHNNNELVLDPQGCTYLCWLFVVSVSFLYNAWVIPLRSSFPVHTSQNSNIWLAIDAFADIIYLFDIIFIKHRIMYLRDGFWVYSPKLTRKNYMKKTKFKMDLISLMPLEILYLKYGTQATYLRAPRLLKIQCFWELFRLLDRIIASPYPVRVGRTLSYILYMIHITACAYYAFSDYQGLKSDRWVYNGNGCAYVRCFAFATKIATSIGKNPKPETVGELLFMIVSWLMGVFIFALLIGQIRDIIATATRPQTEYRQLVDATSECMRRLNLPNESIDRIKKWFKFTFEQQRTINENLILEYLPLNVRTDIAIAVHVQTLSKVQLFANCEEALLRELVLKLRPMTFLPGSYVCRKGEIGREMYIIKSGQVQVIGGPNNDEILAILGEGSVFGEISLLTINGIDCRRRTADVRSRGYSHLFILSKADLNEALELYPQAQSILKHRAQSVMRKNDARERNRTK